MWLKIMFGFLTTLVLIIGYAAFQPSQYVISRSIEVAASTEKVFPFLNNQKLAQKWAPWSEVDPEAKMSLSGPDEGVGAKASWDSRGQLGTGSATIIESNLNQQVRLKLEYTKPMAMTQIADYLLEPKDASTQVTWRVEGENNLLGRVMCLFFDMDQMVGSMFEKGLSNLKKMAEQQSEAQ